MNARTEENVKKEGFLKRFAKAELSLRGDPPRRFDRTRKALVILFAIALIATINIVASNKLQSAFVHKKYEESSLLFDKYLPKETRNSIKEFIPQANEGFFESLGIKLVSDSQPLARIFTDRHYALINLSDRVLKKALSDAKGIDLIRLRSISQNMYANELAADCITAGDGQIILVTANGEWQKALVHAECHAWASRNMPSTIYDAINRPENVDIKAYYDFRFVDEVFALYAGELFMLSGTGQTMAENTRGYFRDLGSYYNPETGPLGEKEYFIWMATWNPPSKSSRFFYEVWAFADYCLGEYGYDGMNRLLGLFINGQYSSFDGLFAEIGGFDNAYNTVLESIQ